MPQKPSVPIKVIGKMNPGVAYTERHAVRAVLYNPASQQVAIIHIVKGNYYKLPGGGNRGG